MRQSKIISYSEGKGRWVSVKDSLPNEQGDVKYPVKMVTETLDITVRNINVRGAAWWIDGAFNTGPHQRVTHWWRPTLSVV